LGAVYLLQLVVGAFNVVLKAPVAMQLIHLFISDMIWVSLILLAANALAADAVAAPLEERAARPASLAERTI
jgi:heme A synthase